jgi:ADP-ribose pyrophosphatase
MAFHEFISWGAGWGHVSQQRLLTTPHLEVETIAVTSPTRLEPFEWTVVHRKAAVVVVPVTADGGFVMVRQERVPVRASLWEFPAGQIDVSGVHGEAIIRETGLRELREESGMELTPGGEILSLGHFFPSAGFTDEHSHLLLMRPVRNSATGASPDEMEAITETGVFEASEVRAMIADGTIRDANSLAAFARLMALGLF